MKLSVIILNYNVQHYLELCLQSVEAAIVNLDAEIIVVDNHSSDDSCKMVKHKFPKVKLIANNENLGFSKGNNIGVEAANGEYLCILNPDTVLAEDTFTKILDFATGQDKLGIVGCKLIDGTGHFLPESKRNLPTPFVAFKKLLGFPKSYYASYLDENDTGEISVLVGAFMVMKHSLYSQLNGFDEDFFMYGEDIDLSYRATKLGYKNFYYGNIEVIHFKGESTLKDQQYASRFFGAMKIFYRKHFKNIQLVNLLVFAGIKLAFLTRASPKLIRKCSSRVLFYGKSSYLESQLSARNSLQFIESSSSILPDATIVFDCNKLSFKSIINIIHQNRIKRNTCFKILPKKVNFILGSHTANTQGTISWLKDF